MRNAKMSVVSLDCKYLKLRWCRKPGVAGGAVIATRSFGVWAEVRFIHQYLTQAMPQKEVIVA